MRRILTTCTGCGAQVQTDDDQVPRDSDLFHELVYNLTSDDLANHAHTLNHQEV